MLAGMEEVGTGLLDRLDAMQRVAASAPGGPMLIVAGPGTGKTRTLTHRIAYLCADLNVDPSACLAITFTRRAAEEVADRLRGLLGEVANDVTVATFHALCLAMLREHPARVGLSPAFRIAEDPDRSAALEAATGDSSLSRAHRAPLDRLDAADRERYVAELRSRDLVDVDELVTLTVDLLGDAPDLTDAYRRRWSWLFVDEYQDVDQAQYDLLRLLCPPDGNLCAIGDPDQAIYGFRGSDVSFFLRFAADYADARVVRLARNYRSSAPIVATALQAIAPSTLVRGRRLEPARSDADAPQVGRYAAASVADEADFVVRTIDELVGGVSHRSLDSGRVDSRDAVIGALSFADIAVLYRTDAQAAPIVDALSRAGIPVQKRSHDRLRDRLGVAAIAREMRFAAGRGPVSAGVRRAAAAVIERLRTPTLDADVSLTLSDADIHLAVDVLMPLASRCGDDIEAFLTEIATDAEVDALDPRAQAVTLLTLHAAKGLEFPVVFLVGCEDGLLPLRLPGATVTGAHGGGCSTGADGASTGPRGSERANEVAAWAVTSEADSMVDSKVDWTVASAPAPADASAPASAEAAASVEWAGIAKAAASAEAAGIAEAAASAEAAGIAEERRLFFVGLTRAQDRLFLSHARRRRWRGADRNMTPSRFFDAIDPRLFLTLGDAAPRRPRDQQLRLL
jgi:superfamily I DNA/RNA helicase